jgi:hypothetical protein
MSFGHDKPGWFFCYRFSKYTSPLFPYQFDCLREGDLKTDPQ